MTSASVGIIMVMPYVDGAATIYQNVHSSQESHIQFFNFRKSVA